jgi:hypothetical protein
MKNIFMRHMENLVSNNRRYGRCARCGGAWNWKRGHHVDYNERGSGSMFPICEDCWSETTPYVRYNYCVNLVRSWGLDSKSTSRIDWGVVAKNCGMVEVK